jgi:hypothetical protein
MFLKLAKSSNQSKARTGDNILSEMIANINAEVDAAACCEQYDTWGRCRQLCATHHHYKLPSETDHRCLIC